MRSRSPRLDRRRAQTRARILHTAARHFAASGVEGVRLDAIADEADVARGTLYNYFPSKEALVSELIRPVLEQGLARARGLCDLGPRRGVDALLALYLELWRDHADALRVAHQPWLDLPAELVDLHRQFLGQVLRVFDRSAAAGVLRVRDAALAGRILGRLAVPLLELYATVPADQFGPLFVGSMRGLLLRS